MPKKAEAFELFLTLWGRGEVGGIRKLQRFVPELKTFEHLKDSTPAITCASPTSAESVELRMSRIGKEALCHTQSIVGPSKCHPVPA